MLVCYNQIQVTIGIVPSPNLLKHKTGFYHIKENFPYILSNCLGHCYMKLLLHVLRKILQYDIEGQLLSLKQTTYVDFAPRTTSKHLKIVTAN